MGVRTRFIVLGIALLVLAGCAATTQQTVQPAVVTAEAGVVDIAGTTWSGMDIFITNLVPYQYIFHADGILEYRYQGNIYKNGTWRQEGDTVYMEMNNHFADRVGRISGDQMEGKGWNKKGQKWEWHINRLTSGSVESAPVTGTGKDEIKKD